MIRERDTPGDFLQHLAEFRANGMQLSQFESKPVCLLRLCTGLLGRISNPSPAFPAEGLGRAVSCGGVSPAVASEARCHGAGRAVSGGAELCLPPADLHPRQLPQGLLKQTKPRLSGNHRPFKQSRGGTEIHEEDK